MGHQRQRIIYEPPPTMMRQSSYHQGLTRRLRIHWQRTAMDRDGKGTHRVLDAREAAGAFIFRDKLGDPRVKNIIYIERTDDDQRMQLDDKRAANLPPKARRRSDARDSRQ